LVQIGGGKKSPTTINKNKSPRNDQSSLMDLYSKKTDNLGKNSFLQSKSMLESNSRTRSKNDDLRMLVSLSKVAPVAKG